MAKIKIVSKEDGHELTLEEIQELILDVEFEVQEVEQKQECPHGGDIDNDCAECVYSTDYHFDKKTGECVERNP